MFRKRSRSADDEKKVFPRERIQPITIIENEKTLVWRFPIHISQSSIGGKTQLSNACTLIALKIAELIHFHDIDMPTPLLSQQKRKVPERVLGGAEMNSRNGGECFVRKLQNLEVDVNNNSMHSDLRSCPSKIVKCLINGIIDGNEAYSKDAGHESTRVYNLPDAIKACDQNFAEVDFKLSTGSITESLPKLINLAVRSPMFASERRLIFVMIGCIRTVLIVFDRKCNSLTLFDTHMHLWHDNQKNQTLKHGALIGTCSYSCLSNFAEWVQHFVFPDINRAAEEFEISLVQLTQLGDRKAQSICKNDRNFTFPVRFPVFKTSNSSENKENFRQNRARLSSSPQNIVETADEVCENRGKTAVRFKKWRRKWLFWKKPERDQAAFANITH